MKQCSVVSSACAAISFLNCLGINIFPGFYTFYTLLFKLPLENICVITKSQNIPNPLFFCMKAFAYYKKCRTRTSLKNSINVGYVHIT